MRFARRTRSPNDEPLDSVHWPRSAERAGAPAGDFGLPSGATWLDTAHQGPLPTVAAERAREAIGWKLDPSRIPDEEFFDAPDRLRRSLAALIDGDPSGIALGNSASDGLHALATGLGLEAGDEVLLVRDDFPATVVPWLPLKDAGVRIRYLPKRSALDPEAIAAALGPNTRVFCATWVDSFSHHVLDMEAVGKRCRAAGVLFVVNGTQGVGVRPISVRRAPFDALTCAGYKWLCGPYGTGFCWLSPAVLDRLRTDRRYWLPLAREHGLGRLTDLLDASPPRTAARHDVFGTASFFNVFSWTESVEYVRRVGIDRVAAHNRALVAALLAAALAHGCRTVEAPPPGSASPLLFLEAPRGQSGDILASRLRASGVHVAVREGRLRLSPHLHNDNDDVASFDRALGAALAGGAEPVA